MSQRNISVLIILDCSCGDWKYVEQCGQDCRQFRWRDCNPENCAVEDESVPCCEYFNEL